MTPRSRTFATAITAASLVLAACGSGSGSSAPAPTEPPPTTEAAPVTSAAPTTAPRDTSPPSTSSPQNTVPAAPEVSRWETLLDGVGDDGEVSLEMAIDAFSLAIAPLPGSDVRAQPGEEPIEEASNAVAWVIRQFDELTPEQQAAVGAALSPPEDDYATVPGSEPAGLRSGLRSAPPAQKIGCYGQIVASRDSPGAEQYRAVFDSLVPEIEGRLGGGIELVAPAFLLLDKRDVGLGTAYTWADPGDCDSNSMETCTIHLSAYAEGLNDTAMRGVLAHELMHCLQFQYLGMVAYNMPGWILEGVPAWVGEDIAGGTSVSTKWWTKYLTSPERSLYSREYDAIGFYAHLAEVGVDPWSRFVAMFDAYSFEPAFDAAWANSGSFLESWPSSVLRRTDVGRAWDADGPGITIDRANPKSLRVGNGSSVAAEVGKVSGGLYEVSIDADLVTFQHSGWARLGAPGGVDVVIESGTTYCARPGGCACPGGGGRGELEQIGSDVFVGLTGGTVAAELTITGEELDCTERDEPQAAVDPCLVGRWVSTAVYIPDTVTGAPVTELGGGAGIVLDIQPDGSFTMDFDSSTPVASNVAGIVMSHQTRGVGHGRITAEGGKVILEENDYPSALFTEFSFGGGVAGGIGIGTGSYACGAGSVEMRSPYDLGEAIHLFVAA